MLLVLVFVLLLFAILFFMFWLNKSHNPSNINTNVFSLVGKDGIVTKNINSLESTGQVKVSGELWSATSNGGNIEKGTTITVVDVDGVKLIVEPK